MTIILFFIYLIAGYFLITRIKFVSDSKLGANTVLLLFLIKITAGCILGLTNTLLFNNQTDYDLHSRYGMEEYQILITDPYLFFTDIFKSNYAEYGEYFGSSGSYWNDLRTNIILKILGVFNIFSRGNYYVNSLFFNFFSFLGHIALFRVFIHVYPGKKSECIIGSFLLPSFLYFSSGIHKDLLVFTALAIFCYSLYFCLEKSFTRKRIFFLVLSFFTILLIRNFIAALLLPCAIAWLISSRYKLKSSLVFTVMLVSGMVATIFLNLYFPKLDPLRIVTNKQHAFLSLGKATTLYNNDTLQPTITHFAAAAPKAIRHSFLSPYPGEFKNGYSNLFAVEIIFYLILFLLFLIIPSKNIPSSRAFVLFGLTFTFLVFLFSGYITTAAGALIRYRSIYWPFLILPLLCSINWSVFRNDHTGANAS